jgi:hypothetical protein
MRYWLEPLEPPSSELPPLSLVPAPVPLLEASPPMELPPLIEPLPVPGLVLLPLASLPLPLSTEPGGNAPPVPDGVPASISVEGGIPPLSTGGLPPEDWAKTAMELTDRIPARVSAVTFDFIMVSLPF